MGRLMWRRWPTVVLLGLVVGCGNDESDAADDYKGEDIPPGSCTGDACDPTGGSSTGTGGSGDSGGTGGSGSGSSDGSGTTAWEDECQSSEDCPGGEMCVAPFAGTDRGALECVTVCVDVMDESRWCADDAACCSPAAACTARGYCVLDGSDTGETATGTGGTSTGTTGATGTGGTGTTASSSS